MSKKMQTLQFLLRKFWFETQFCLGRAHVMHSCLAYPESMQL